MKFLSASPVTAFLLASVFSTPIFSLPPQPTSSVTPILLQSRHDYPLYTPAVQRRFKMQPDGSMKEVTSEGIQMLSSTWTVRCYNSGLWMPIAKITPHINTFCANENGRRVVHHFERLFVENFGATNGGTANLKSKWPCFGSFVTFIFLHLFELVRYLVRRVEAVIIF